MDSLPPQIFFSFLAGILILIVGLFVFLKNKRDAVHWLFFFFAGSISMWINGFGLALLTENVLFGKFIMFAGAGMTCGLYLFSLIFPYKKQITLREWISILPIAVIAFAVFYPDIILEGIRVHGNGYLEPVNGVLFPIYAITLASYAYLAIKNLTKTYKHSEGIEKLQMKYFFVGGGVLVFGAFVFDVLLPSFGITSLNLVGPITSLIFVFFTAYAILRHQLLDIRIVIQRGIVYTMLLTFIVGIYLLLISVLSYEVHITTDLASILAAGITAVTGIFSTPTIDRYLRRLTDKFLFKDSDNIDLDIIIDNSTEKLKEIFRTAHADILSTEKLHENSGVVNYEYECKIPIEYEGETRGYIFLGKKLSGDAYTQEDYSLLQTFSEQAAVAIKKAQLLREVENYSLELEEKVKVRTAEIERLQSDQEQMMIDISHQLQDPLTLAKIEVEAIKKMMPKEKEVADALERSVDEISEFTYRLMRLAKLHHAAHEFEKENMSLSELLEETMEYFKVLAGEKGISVIHYIEPGLMIRGHKKNLEELVTNLLSNAIKYNVRDTADKKIYVGLLERDGKLHLTVEDTGVGIEPEEIPRIFDRFHKIRQDPKFNIKSTGLGLSIVKGVVDLHKGNIEVHSTVGKGTAFCIFFPKNG